MKKIVLICNGQPSTNPRTVKEATALADAGFGVTVIYNYTINWANETDKIIINGNKTINWILVGVHPAKNKIADYMNRLRHKIQLSLAALFPGNLFLQQSAESKWFSANLRVASKLDADLFISHNLGALPVAAIAAARKEAIFSFDAEDYYRGQYTRGSLNYKRVTIIEDHYLPRVKYLTVASPMIGERYQAHYPFLNPLVINNVFTWKRRAAIQTTDSKEISIFWFSQTVGENRGLEITITALNSCAGLPIHLYLLGNCSAEYQRKLLNQSSNNQNIHFLDPVSLKEIFCLGEKFDIGLASELPLSENRDVCLTNKLFIYLLCGNCILASDTSSQKRFMSENPGIGFLYRHDDPEVLAALLKKIFAERDVLDSCKTNSVQLSVQKYNWEIESDKFLQIIRNAFSMN